jgi:hypothetical protein
VVQYKPHEVANIPPQLEEILLAILSGEYNKTTMHEGVLSKRHTKLPLVRAINPSEVV